MHKNNFDFLRLFAAMLVLWSHEFVVAGSTQPIVFGLRSAGTLGVYIFFAISGYLVTQSWLRNPDIGVFFVNRIVRVWPAFATVTVIVALVLGPIVTTEHLIDYLLLGMTRDYISQLTFDMRYRLPGVFERNFYPGMASSSTWTIPFELQWYCVVLMLGVTGVLKNRRLACLLSVGYVAYVCMRQGSGVRQDGAYPQELGACFLVGLMLAALRNFWVSKSQYVFVGAVAGAAGSLAFGQGIVGLLVFVPVAAVAFGEGSYRMIAQAGRFGDFSYGVYLWAWPVQQTIAWSLDNKLTVTAGICLSVPITMACAAMSWHFVEQPSMQWKLRKYASRSRQTAIGSGAG